MNAPLSDLEQALDIIDTLATQLRAVTRLMLGKGMPSVRNSTDELATQAVRFSLEIRRKLQPIHIVFNDSIDPNVVIGIVYFETPAAIGRVIQRTDAGRLQIQKRFWNDFKNQVEAVGITTSWGFN